MTVVWYKCCRLPPGTGRRDDGNGAGPLPVTSVDVDVDNRDWSSAMNNEHMTAYLRINGKRPVEDSRPSVGRCTVSSNGVDSLDELQEGHLDHTEHGGQPTYGQYLWSCFTGLR